MLKGFATGLSNYNNGLFHLKQAAGSVEMHKKMGIDVTGFVQLIILFWEAGNPAIFRII